MLNVAIVNCATRGCDSNISNLERIFHDEFFTVTIVNPKNCDDLFATKEILESFHNSDEPLLILKDSSICQLSSKSLSKMIKQALRYASENHLDLLYLCSAGERCEKQSDLLYFEDGTRLRTTGGNRSTQAILYTKKARKIIMKQLNNPGKTIPEIIKQKVSSNELKVALFSPNIVHFDLEMAKSKSEYAEANVCTSMDEETSNTGIYIWFIILVILLILVAWGLIQINPRYHNNNGE